MRSKLFLAIAGVAIFLTLSAQPTINSFSPLSGPVGSTVTITGTNFTTVFNQENIVFFGAVRANVINASSTQLTVIVPSGATYDRITVISNLLSCRSRNAFIPTYSNTALIDSNAFSVNTPMPTDSVVNEIKIADIDGDGKPDLVGTIKNSIYIWRNLSSDGASSPSFASAYAIVIGGTPINFAIGDITGDGKLDIAIANNLSSSITLLRNNSVAGNLSLSWDMSLTAPGLVSNVIIEDIDGDGKPDVISSNSGSNSISIFKNIGTSGVFSFLNHVDFGAGIQPGGIQGADMDGDGKTDLVITSSNGTGGGRIYIYQNNATKGSINTASFPGPLVLNLSNEIFNYSIGDLNQDGKPDILYSSPSGLNVYQNTSSPGNISVGPIVNIPTSLASFSTQLADITGDGIPDILEAGITWGIAMFKIMSTGGTIGTGSFAPRSDLKKNEAYRLAAGDLNADGRVDIAASFTTSKVYTFTNKTTVDTSAVISVNLGNNPSACSGSLTTSLAYTINSGAPTKYSITWNDASISAGFVNKVDAALSPSSINIAVPLTAAAGVYSANIVFTNNNGVSGSVLPFSIQLRERPTVAPISGNTSICIGPTTTKLSSATTGGIWTSQNTSIATISNDPGFPNGMVNGLANGTDTIYYSVTDTFNCSTTVITVLSVGSVPPPPVITGQPVSVKVAATATTSMTVSTANGTVPRTYSWQVSNNGGSSWTTISSAGQAPLYGNWTTNILSISVTNTAVNGYKYRCIITDAITCGSSTTTSEAATLTVVDCAGPTILANPENVSVNSVAPAIFSTRLTGGVRPYIYQWQVSKDAGITWINITASGTKPVYAGWSDSSLTITNISTQQNDFRYRCVITSGEPCGNFQVTTAAAKMSVPVICLAPVINTGSQQVITMAGSTASFSITASGGIPPIIYQWQVSKNGGTSWDNIVVSGTGPSYSNWTTPLLSLQNIQGSADAFQYRCLVSSTQPCSDSIATSYPAILYVSPCTAPDITAAPKDVSLIDVTSADFSVEASGGNQPYSFKWQVSSDNGSNWTDIKAAGTAPVYANWTSATLSLSNISSQHNLFKYRCLVSSGTGGCTDVFTTSDAAVLSVSSSCFEPSIVTPPQSTIVTASSGTRFSVIASESGSAFTYQWQVSADGGNNWNNITTAGSAPVYGGFNSSSLTLTSVTDANDGYQYRCIVTNGTPCNTKFTESSPATLSVSKNCISPVMASQPEAVGITQGDIASFSANVIGGTTPYSYQWQVSTDAGQNWTNISATGSAPSYTGWTGATLSLTGIALICNGYQYRCIITSSKPCTGSLVISDAAKLSVISACTAPIITNDPVALNTTIGDAASLSVSASGGVTPYSYLWQVSTTNGSSWTTINSAGSIPSYSGWTTPKLSLAGIGSKNDKYQYRAIVLSGKTCQTMTVSSNPAILNVSSGCTAPKISSHPVTTTATVSGTTGFSVSASDGTAPYTYQWQVSTTNGSSWTNISSAGNSPAYANWTTASLKLTNIAASNNNYRYRCVVSSGGPCGSYSSNSNGATLTVTNNCTPPFIDRSPVSTNAAVGSTTSFSVTVGGSVGYQWQVSKDGGNSWNDILSAGSGPTYANWSTTNLSVSGILLTNNGFKYRCVVRPTGNCSNVSSNSDAANLGVSATVQYTVSVAAATAASGSVTGGGVYNSGANVLVKATANAGYSFTKWVENGTEVSTNTNFSFTANANRTLTAAFSANVVTYIDLGDIRIFADKIPATGTTRTLTGNVFAIPKSNCTGNVGVHFPSTILINTNDNTITGTGEVYCENVGSWGKIVILNGFFTLKASGDVFTSPIFNAATQFYKLAGLKLKITDLQVLCDGSKMEGELSLPSDFFSGKISGAINALYFTKSGINLNGKIAFKDLNLKGVIPVDELSLAFDTKTKDYSGSLTLKYPLFSVSGEFAFINGKFDKVGVEYASNLKPIPLGTLPLAMTQIHGAVSGISTSSYLFDFDATIAPAAGVAIPAIGNITLQASYRYRDAFDASATLNIFKQNLASARLSVKRDLFNIRGDLSLFDVLKGHADMSIAKVNGNAKLTGNFNGGLYAPEFKPLWLKPLNLAYKKGKLMASSDNYITSEYIAGRAMVKGVKFLFGDIKVFYVLKYNDFEFDWKSNKSDLPLEAQQNLPNGKPIVKPALTFSSSPKTNGVGIKVNGVKTNPLSYSFDVTPNTGTVVITATAKKTPSLSVYVAKGSIINAETAAQFKNVFYYSDSNSVVIWIKNLVPGTYYTWSNDADSINVLSMLPSPEINIRNVVQDKLTRKFKVDFDAYHVNNGATVAIGLDNDLFNENGVILGDSIRLVEGANSAIVDYSKVSSGKYFLYAGITDNIGQHAFSYDTTVRKVIIDSAPNTPSVFLIEKNAGKYFVSFERNNPSPMGYQLHYAAIEEELTLQSPVIPMGDTNYAELKSLPPGRSYRLAVSAMDSIGRQSDLSNSDTLLFNSPGLNSVPYFESHDQKGKVKAGSLYNVLLQAKDADNDPLQYSLSSGPAAAGINNLGVLTWTPAAAEAGYQQIYLKVSDGRGGTDSMRLELQVYDSLSSTPSLSLDKAGINNYTETLLTQVSDPLVSSTDKLRSVQVHISSDTDSKGIDVPAIVSTGPVSEFSTPVNFSAGPSSGNTIKANKGDTIRISYTSSYSGVTVQNYAIFKPLRADFILTDSLCNTDTVHMFNASKGTSLRYTWTFGDGTLGSDKNPNHLFPITTGKGNSSYQIKLTIVDLNDNTDSVTKTVTIYHVPAKTIIASGPLSFCFGDSVKLTAGAAEKYLWSTGAISAGISVNKSGVYHYISSNGSACFTMDTVAVTVNPLPTVNAGVNADIKLGTNIQLGGIPTAAGNGPFLYRWSPSAGLLSDSVANPIAVPYKPTVYTLHVTDINGCMNSDNVVVKVSPVIMEDVMLVYPNPATTQIRIVIILPSDMLTNIAIYDFNGLLHKKVVENRLIKKGYQLFEVSIADLASGTYYVRFNSKQTKIFVKQ